MSDLKFFQLDTLGRDDKAFIEKFKFEKKLFSNYEMMIGKSVSNVFSPNTAAYLSKDSALELGSLIGNTDSILVVSKEFKELITAQCPEETIEYLPLTVYDYKGTLLSVDYFIINPIGMQDCMNLEASKFSWDDENKRIVRSDKIVIHKDKASALPQLFRPNDATEYIVGVNLAQAMYKAQLTNIYWEQLEIA